MMIKRGDIYWAEFTKQKNSHVIYKTRPVIVVSNNTANRFSPIISVVPVTGQERKMLPTHVKISGHGLPGASTVLTEQVISIDKTSLHNKIGTLAGTDELREIDKCLCIQLGVA